MNERAKKSMRGPADIGDLSPRRYFGSVAVVLGLVFAFVAGESDGSQSLLRSLLQWQLQSILPMVLLLAAHILLSRWAWFEGRSPWAQLVVSGLSGSLLFTLPASLIDIHFLGDTTETLGFWLLADEFSNIAPPVTLIWVAINAPFILGLRLRAPANTAEAVAEEFAGPSESESRAQFMDLLPSVIRGEVLYLEAELHYLSVVTDRGKALILYNLRDAIVDLNNVPGVQTHRAFWVARQHVEKFWRTGRQGRIRMKNGDVVPVSRRRLADVAELLD